MSFCPVRCFIIVHRGPAQRHQRNRPFYGLNSVNIQKIEHNRTEYGILSGALLSDARKACLLAKPNVLEPMKIAARKINNWLVFAAMMLLTASVNFGQVCRRCFRTSRSSKKTCGQSLRHAYVSSENRQIVARLGAVKFGSNALSGVG